jgi:hypothetical protein
MKWILVLLPLAASALTIIDSIIKAVDLAERIPDCDILMTAIDAVLRNNSKLADTCSEELFDAIIEYERKAAKLKETLSML